MPGLGAIFPSDASAMTFLTNTPLRQKLTWLAMTCSIVALLTTAVALGAYEWVFYRRTMFSHLTTLAQVTARNTSSSLTSPNPEDGDRILAALQAEPAVVAAVLYDSRGRRFAEFKRIQGQTETVPLSHAPEDGVQVVGAELRIAVPVVDRKREGTLLVIADIGALGARVAPYGIVLVCTTLVSGLLAYLLTGWLKERIVGPVQALAAAATHVQQRGDYSVRVRKEAEDEVGAMTDAFNEMLLRIQQKEAELARSAERLRIAVESAGIGTWDWDLRTGFLGWNDRNYDLFGLERGSPVSATAFYAGIHPDDRERARSAIAAAMTGGRDFTTDARIIPANRPGSPRHVVLHGRFLVENGTVHRAVGVTVDVTERHNAELRVIESERRFRAVAERAPAMIWSCDAVLHRDYFNKTWLAFTGRPLEAERGTGWQQGVPESDLARWRDIVATALLQRDPYTIEYRLRRADGAWRWVVETGSPRLAADGAFAGYLGSCIDITARKENEEELEAHVRLRTRELQAANQELESFSYSVSHDLRGPVRAVQGFAEIALEEIEAGNLASARERVERVIGAANRMNKLIDAFISMARISRTELRIDEVNLTAVAEDVATFLRSTNPRRAVEIAIDPGLVARGDERLLRIVLENLLGNAWKFTSKTEQARIEFTGQRNEREMVFCVRDNGAGFDPALSHKLFHAFERLHSGSQFEGMGVGLNTVYRIVEKHAGRVWAEAHPGEGAAFYFSLPSRPHTGTNIPWLEKAASAPAA